MSGSALPVVASVLDRLLDDGGGDAQGAGRGPGTPAARALPARAQSVQALAAAVRRDLEALLNARRPWASLPDRYATLRGSILGYGLPDFAAGAFNALTQREALCREIAATIRRFEPRMTELHVSLAEPDSIEPVLRIRIKAVLHAEGADTPIGFETFVDATTTDMLVRTEGNV
jgi:type VI secretion system protein ImpF